MPTTLPFSISPDTTTTLVSRSDAGTTVAFLRIEYDRDAQNPCDDDGVGTIEVFRRGVTNLDDVNVKLADPQNVLLSRYEHGNVLYFVDGLEKGHIPDRRWDVTNAVALWTPDRYTVESCPISEAAATRDPAQAIARREWFRAQAQAACEVYTDYCNGNVFGYTLEVYAARVDEGGDVLTDLEDYHRETPVTEDSCWGFVGDDAIAEAVGEVLAGYKLADAQIIA